MQMKEEVSVMKIDGWLKAALWIIAVMLVLNFAHRILIARPAQAIGTADQIGRYQITAWSSYTGGVSYHSGYYILDTVTGKVVGAQVDAHQRELEKQLQSD
jgi:hypothetical protein